MSGSLMITSWNLLLSAASFSMYFWYSLKVVEPMSLIFPLERSGFSICAASPFSWPHAPMMVWISSMKRMMSLVGSMASSKMDFILASNSPLYLVPATKVPISSKNILLFWSFSGTSPLVIFCANPSTTAVLPTPASPMSRGLFLFFLKRV